jgi:hypothetical protein
MLARVVTFEGVDAERMEAMAREVERGERPEDLPARELVILHDPEAERAMAVLFFENEDDYRRGDEILNAMPADETPGRRTSVARYRVAVRTTPTASG